MSKASASLNQAQAHAARLEACRALLGESLESALIPWGAAVDTLTQLEALFKAIGQAVQSQEGINPFHVAKLAELGEYIAGDVANTSGGAYEEIQRAVQHIPQ